MKTNMNDLTDSQKILQLLINTAGDRSINLLFKKKHGGKYIFKLTEELVSEVGNDYVEYDIFDEDEKRMVSQVNFFSKDGVTSEIDLSYFGLDRFFQAWLFLEIFFINKDLMLENFLEENYEKLFNDIIFKDILKIIKKNIMDYTVHKKSSTTYEDLFASLIEKLPYKLFNSMVEKSLIDSRELLKEEFLYINNPRIISLFSKVLKKQTRFLADEKNKLLISELISLSLTRFPDIKKEVATHHQFLHNYIREKEDFNFLVKEKSHLNTVKIQFDLRKIHANLAMQKFTLQDTENYFNNIIKLIIQKLTPRYINDYDISKQPFDTDVRDLFLQFNEFSTINSKTIEDIFINCVKQSQDFNPIDCTNNRKMIPLINSVLMDLFLPEKIDNKKTKNKI